MCVIVSSGSNNNNNKGNEGVWIIYLDVTPAFSTH